MMRKAAEDHAVVAHEGFTNYIGDVVLYESEDEGKLR